MRNIIFKKQIMAVILITGANGQLGNELKEVSKNYYGYDFIFTDTENLDLTDGTTVSEFIGGTAPDWIINCAAYNFVDKAEAEPGTAMKVNGLAVKNLTNAIAGTECRLIHVSTDYVYDGNASVPYDENAPVSPLTAYGVSKLAGEKYALLHPSTMVIRTSWLYSSYGTNFAKTILRAAREKGSLRVVFDQTGTPTYAADLARAIMHIISGTIRNHFAFTAGIYNYSDEGVCSWYDFATEIINEAGIECSITPVTSGEYRQAAQRPSYSVMNKAKIRETYGLTIPHWRTSLSQCMKLLLNT
jgi:dTDP-4-dehydrorhamnose reductase